MGFIFGQEYPWIWSVNFTEIEISSIVFHAKESTFETSELWEEMEKSTNPEKKEIISLVDIAKIVKENFTIQSYISDKNFQKKNLQKHIFMHTMQIFAFA